MNVARFVKTDWNASEHTDIAGAAAVWLTFNDIPSTVQFTFVKFNHYPPSYFFFFVFFFFLHFAAETRLGLLPHSSRCCFFAGSLGFETRVDSRVKREYRAVMNKLGYIGRGACSESSAVCRTAACI